MITPQQNWLVTFKILYGFWSTLALKSRQKTNITLIKKIKFCMYYFTTRKTKLAREISDGKNEIPHKFLVTKFSDGIREGFHVFPH